MHSRVKIYKILFDEDNRTIFYKVFGSKGKVDRKNREEAEVLMRNLLSVSGTLLEAINLLEREIKDMSDDELASIY